MTCRSSCSRGGDAVTVNPIYDLMVEALICADSLALGDGTDALLHDAVERCRFLGLPEWLPQFVALVEAMGENLRKPTVQAWGTARKT